MDNTPKWGWTVIGGLVGLILGMNIGTWISPRIDKSKIFQRENKPSVIRHYKEGADQVMVENPKLKGEYMTLTKYLDTIQDAADRGIEEAKILKAVKWYSE